MLYFDIRPCLKRLSNEQLGELFMSIMDYGEFGNVPDFQDQLIGMAWDIIQQRLDNDDMRYKEKCEKAAKSVKARWGKEKQKDEHTNVYERIETYTDEHIRIRENTKQYEDIRTIPTTTSTTKSTSNPTSTSTSISSTTTPPTLEEVIAYAETRFIPMDFAERFFDYYDAGQWIDSKGNHVRNWKQKLSMWWTGELDKIKKQQKQDDEKKAKDRNRIRTDEEYLADKDFFGDD